VSRQSEVFVTFGASFLGRTGSWWLRTDDSAGVVWSIYFFGPEIPGAGDRPGWGQLMGRRLLKVAFELHYIE